MKLHVRLFDDGLRVDAGRGVVYDIERNQAHAGAATIDGSGVVWEIGDNDGGAALSAPVDLDPSKQWLMRCDRVDFPPGGVAFEHTHPGPGIRVLLHGTIRIDSGGASREYGPLDPWFESGPEPVFAQASASAETAFVRVLLLPAEWAGRRTIRYVDAADADKPKTQRATVFLEQPIIF